MADYKVIDAEQLDADLTTVADAIREKNGTETTYKLSEMGTAIRAIESGGSSEEFIGIKFSDFTTNYKLPTIADVRSIPSANESAWAYTENRFDSMFSNSTGNLNGGHFSQLEEVFIPDNIYAFSSNMFNFCTKLTDIHGDFTDTVRIKNQAFRQCKALTKIPYLPNLEIIEVNAFMNCTGLTSINFYKKLSSCASTVFNGCTNIKDIYVPWSEGEVANAPWGATNATIHYNTTYDENHNPIV